jgi:negative regulator of sigma-B (phosphoserine phosphatase)
VTIPRAIRWTVRERPRRGESVSGDRAVVIEGAASSTFAVIDVLGHGPVASDAADEAARALRAGEGGTVADAIGALGGALRGTRGAAALVLVVDGDRLSAGGVGNVELRADGLKLSVALVPGIVGARHGPPVVFDAVAVPGGRIAVFSDGLSQRLDLGAVRGLPLEEAAAALFERHATTTDDATLLLLECEASS